MNKLQHVSKAFQFLFLLFAWQQGLAQNSNKNVVLSNTEKHRFTSTINKTAYELQIMLPDGYDPKDTITYPTLYVLDGNLYAPLARSIQQLLMGDDLVSPMIIVGIGYPVNAFNETFPMRTQDFTPSSVKSLDTMFSQQFNQQVTTGGAATFLQVIQKEIIPLVAAKVRVNANRALFGHSFGGLFAASLLFEQQSAFNSLIISSPTLDWDGKQLFKREEQFAKSHKALPLRLCLSVGLDDEKSIVKAVQSFATLLNKRQYKGLTLDTSFFPSEKHMSVVPEALEKGIRFLYAVKPAPAKK